MTFHYYSVRPTLSAKPIFSSQPLQLPKHTSYLAQQVYHRLQPEPSP